MPKKTTPAPKKGAVAKKKQEPKENPLFEKRPRVFSIGGAIRPRTDVTRFVRWPRYVKLQRQRRILLTRLKVPPTINQFSKTLDKSSAQSLFKLLLKYRPETSQAKKKRLVALAQAKANKETVETKTPHLVKYGINNVTSLVEQKKAKLVVIAHDVDPIEIVVWLPTLCRKMDVPYCIVKGKSRLGQVVHKKNATALALTDINKEDANTLKELSGLAHDTFNKNTDLRRMWGGGKMGVKSVAATRKKEKAIQKEQSSKNKTV
jgi:large subunit ribosomal protein L7Ae